MPKSWTCAVALLLLSTPGYAVVKKISVDEAKPDPKTYCIVDGQRQDFAKDADYLIVLRRESANVKCVKAGAVYMDLRVVSGKRNGITTQEFNSGEAHETHITTYVDGLKQGVERVFNASGKLVGTTRFDHDERVGYRHLYPDGKIKSLGHYLGRSIGWAELEIDKEGKVQKLHCKPDASEDEFRDYCGFSGRKKTSVYDGTGKVNQIVEYERGQLMSTSAGDSDYAPKSTATYVGGKKQGIEKILDPHGARVQEITWKDGLRDGISTTYDAGSQKVLSKEIWQADELKEHSEFYLNGKQKLKEIYGVRDRKQVSEYHDNGKPMNEGAFVRCKESYWGYVEERWCEEGLHSCWQENGQPLCEEHYSQGKLDGVSKYYEEKTGALRAEASYSKGTLKRLKKYEKGKLTTNEEYEADGSRKQH